jgi:hypothetical protein
MDWQHVENLFLLLAPSATDATEMREGLHKKRLLVMEHNRMPNITPAGILRARQVSWCHVDTVSHHWHKIAQALKTDRVGQLGENKSITVPAARVVAEGYYVIVTHENHTYLVVHLLQPEPLGSVPASFHLAPLAAYILTVHDPAASTDRLTRAGSTSFPPYLLEPFEGKKEWQPLHTTDYLDHEGVELCVVGAARDAELDLDKLGVKAELLDQEGVPKLTHVLEKHIRATAKGRRMVPLKEDQWA